MDQILEGLDGVSITDDVVVYDKNNVHHYKNLHNSTTRVLVTDLVFNNENASLNKPAYLSSETSTLLL